MAWAFLEPMACASKSEVLQRFGLAGARLHARTKLVDLRNRVYATHMRAFLTKDPLGNVDSEGLWNYTAGDPINLRDPWGLATQTDDPAPDDNDDDDDDGLSRGPDYGGDNWPVPRDPDSPIKYPGDGEKGDKPWNFTVFGDCDDKCERDEAKRFLGDLAPNEKVQGITEVFLPPGLGQLILPSGEIVPAIAARLAPSASGGYISAFPIP